MSLYLCAFSALVLNLLNTACCATENCSPNSLSNIFQKISSDVECAVNSFNKCACSSELSALVANLENISKILSGHSDLIDNIYDIVDIIKFNSYFLQLLPDVTESLNKTVRLLQGNARKPRNVGNLSHPKDCQDLLEIDPRAKGVQEIYPFTCCPEKPAKVFCDQFENGGGWTVIQRRHDNGTANRESFQRPYRDYIAGFGDATSEFWAGLDLVHALTSSCSKQRLRINVEDYEGNTRYAEYGVFIVEGPENNYRLIVGNYTGNAGDSLAVHNGQMFTTFDKDNDKLQDDNCATRSKGGWWYESCHEANLNGIPYQGGHSTYDDGIQWSTWKGYNYSLRSVVMKIKKSC